MALVLHHSKAKGTDKVILLGIANHASDDGAWPGVATLAKYANVTERAVQQSLARLVKAREVAITPQAGGTWRTPRHRRPNRYDVLVNCPPECDRTPSHRAVIHRDTHGVKPTSPGEAECTDGVKPTSPGGVKPTSPEPSLEPSMNPGGAVTASTTDRAQVETANDSEGVGVGVPDWFAQERARVMGEAHQ